MPFLLTYAARNLRRNAARTIVTFLGLATLLFLVAGLATIVATLLRPVVSQVSERRLVVRHAVSLTFNLPEAYWSRLRTFPHVQEVAPSNWFGGVYVEPRNFFARFFVDPKTFLSLISPQEVSLPPGAADAWVADRQGCIVPRSLADKFGWKLGDKLTIQGDIYPVNVELNVRGIYTGSVDALYFQRDYVEEALGRPGQVGTYTLLLDSREALGSVSRAIDDAFADSDFPTRTETEQAFRAGFASMLGNVQALMTNLVLILVVTVVLTAGNTMAMAVRERTGEVAILKALGFLPSRILGLVLAESCLLASLAGAAGIGGFWGMTLLLARAGFRPPMMDTLHLPLPWLAGLLVGSALLGALSGAVPGLLAARLRVVDGLRRN